jgi:PucR C-terminal helix-turn-helix domain
MGGRSMFAPESGQVAEFLTTQRHAAVGGILVAADREIAAHGRIKGAERDGYRENLDMLYAAAIRAFKKGRSITDVEMMPGREIARTLARHQFTCDEVLRLVRVGLKANFERVLAQSPPELVVGVMEFISFFQPTAQLLYRNVVPAYQKQLSEYGGAVSHRELVGQSLICGNLAGPAFEEFNPAAFSLSTVVFLSCRRDLPGEGVEHAWRRVAKAMERDNVLWAPVERDLALIFPGSVDKRVADEIHRAAAQEMKSPIWALVSPAVELTEIQRVAKECQACMASLWRLKYPSKWYDMRSLLFERIILSADQGILGQATQLIQKVIVNRMLSDTLTAWIAHHGRRGETAASLGIHPRTLDYRLRRIRALVELDPTEPSTMALLRCASIAWRGETMAAAT